MAESASTDCLTGTSEVAAFSLFASHPGMTGSGRLFPLPVQQQTGAQASAYVKYLGKTGRSWSK
jgi:hypothetical protein